ncbi:response regulator [Hephaestia sp. GCM10023244]|uniref:response regulator n=1 Tax=unclassified Hephaestia TaxID=2631281 RepID=UPI002076EC0D|nr:response regulator [Hephaestia sp. MAHUQ-44]MCM8730151.1 response regulator [Hephaestia sp. MAHUQ-44]
MSDRRHILIVEDEPLIAMMLEDFLDALDHEATATVDTVAEALEKITAGGIDGAILDINLRGGEQCWPIADALAAAGIGFVLASGGSADSIVEAHRNRPLLSKPFTMAAVSKALAAL